MARQFNTQNYPKSRFKKVYLNFINNQGNYNFMGVVENNQGISLHQATASDFYIAPSVAINYAYLGGVIHECNYDLQTESLGNGKQFTFSLNTVKVKRIPGDGDPSTSVNVFDYARAAFKTCYNTNGGWGGNLQNPQPPLIGLSPIMQIVVKFAGSTSTPQIQMDTVYSNILSEGENCNRLNWREYEIWYDPQATYQDIHQYLRYESYSDPGIGFTAKDPNTMVLSLFDNQTNPRETIVDQPKINVPIAAVRYLNAHGSISQMDDSLTGNAIAPLAYFIEEDITHLKYRFNMIKSCDEAFNVNGIFTGEYPYGLTCRSLIIDNDTISIDNTDYPTDYFIKRFYSYPETENLIDFESYFDQV
jgi:hypothetical protein